MTFDQWTEWANADLSPVVSVSVSDEVDRRGNYTLLAQTAVGKFVSLAPVAT
jgi:hypothetical protein